MRLWGWWRKEEPTPASEEPPKLLEDVKPVFEDNKPTPPPALPSLSQTLSGIGADDFRQLPAMPCFRNAMLTGMGIGLTASAVMFASKRQVARSVNWAVGGFVVGSVITWEQCRFRLHRSKRNVQKAREMYRAESSSSSAARAGDEGNNK